jgi:branched-subunit amino acid aminotransferase/4-amino-4-deoxychorismate lyase
LAEKEVKSHSPEAWAVMLDEHGNLCEGMGSNIFVVRGGRMLTPREQYVLPGVSRGMVLDLAAQLGISSEERDLDVYDAVTADESSSPPPASASAACARSTARVSPTVPCRGRSPGDSPRPT